MRFSGVRAGSMTSAGRPEADRLFFIGAGAPPPARTDADASLRLRLAVARHGRGRSAWPRALSDLGPTRNRAARAARHAPSLAETRRAASWRARRVRPRAGTRNRS